MDCFPPNRNVLWTNRTELLSAACFWLLLHVIYSSLSPESYIPVIDPSGFDTGNVSFLRGLDVIFKTSRYKMNCNRYVYGIDYFLRVFLVFLLLALTIWIQNFLFRNHLRACFNVKHCVHVSVTSFS